MKPLDLIKLFFGLKEYDSTENMKKYLIIGLGNIGAEYEETRHNIGFKVLDALASKEDITFKNEKLGAITTFRFKGRTFVLLKPSTYMNLSGKAVRYWMVKEKVSLENILVICDDLNIPFGTLRLKTKGSDGGHNGLKDINVALNTQKYPRFRIGVGAEFKKGKQIDYVLGEWNNKERQVLLEIFDKSCNLIKSFGTAGIANTMSVFNGK